MTLLLLKNIFQFAFFKPWAMSLFLKSSLVQIPTVSSRRILVNNETMNMLESWSTASMVKWNESLTVYLLVVNGSNSAVTASFFSGGNDTKVTKNVISLEYFLSYFLEYLKNHSKITSPGEERRVHSKLVTQEWCYHTQKSKYRKFFIYKIYSKLFQ